MAVGRRGAATLEEAEARMLSRKHAHEQLNGKLAALAAKGAACPHTYTYAHACTHSTLNPVRLHLSTAGKPFPGACPPVPPLEPECPKALLWGMAYGHGIHASAAAQPKPLQRRR